MMRLKEIKGNYGKYTDEKVQVYECGQCGARTYAPHCGELPDELPCSLCGGCGKLSDQYVTALNTVDSYMPVRGDRVRGADYGWSSLQTVFVGVSPGTVTNIRFDLDGAGIKVTRAGIGGNPFYAGYREAFLLALDGTHCFEPQALAKELVCRIAADLGARHAAE